MCVPGKSDSALNIGLNDLLNADRHGKWYLVGSAWHGADSVSTKTETMNSGLYLYIMFCLLIFVVLVVLGSDQDLRSADDCELVYPNINLATYGGQVFAYVGPAILNLLPDDLIKKH